MANENTPGGYTPTSGNTAGTTADNPRGRYAQRTMPVPTLVSGRDAGITSVPTVAEVGRPTQLTPANPQRRSRVVR